MMESIYNKFSDLQVKNYYNYLKDDLIILRYWDKTTNFGDFMNPYIVSSILKKPVVSSFKFINFLNKKELLGMGSIIGGDLSRCVVWGSGIMVPDVKIDAKPKKVLHVRGKKTQQILEREGISTPSLYGDPALLLPEIFSPEKEKKYKLGIIPHYREINHKLVNTVREEITGDFLIIDPLDKFENIIEAINKCENIASSSLHGLIVAEAYDIPTLRLHLSDKIGGGDFKYDDHYSALNLKKHKKFHLEDLKLLRTSGFFGLFTKKEIPIEKQELIANLKDNFS